MRQVIFIFILVLSFFSSQSQNAKYGSWNQQLVVGANASLNSTWIFNSAIQSLDAGVSDQLFSFGWSARASVAFRFSNRLGVGLDLGYFSAKQKYDGQLAAQSQFWESDVRLNGLTVPVYVKLMSDAGAFVEVGWQFGFLLGARYNRFSVAGGSLADNEDVSSSFSKVILAPHLGFGIDLPLSDEFFITLGVRASYGINDLKGIDGLKNDIANYPNTNVGTPISPSDTGPAPSNIFTAGVFLGVRYAFDAGGRY